MMGRICVSDRFVLHDQPVSGRHSDAVLRDEEARDGEDAGRTPSHAAEAAEQLQHTGQQQRSAAGRLLRGDAQVRRAPGTQIAPPSASLRPPRTARCGRLPPPGRAERRRRGRCGGSVAGDRVRARTGVVDGDAAAECRRVRSRQRRAERRNSTAAVSRRAAFIRIVVVGDGSAPEQLADRQ